MICNNQLYNAISEADRHKRLINLSEKQAVQELEELLGLYDSFVLRKIRRPLPVSMNRLMAQQLKK